MNPVEWCDAKRKEALAKMRWQDASNYEELKRLWERRLCQ